MSKDSSAGGTSSIGFEELLRTNPEILERMLQGGMPAAAQQGQQEQQGPVMVRDMTTPQAVESFYGSGDRIVQPDQSYYQDFALPGVQMDRPETAEEAEVREATRQKDLEAERYAEGGSMARTLPADQKTNYQKMLEGSYAPDERARKLGYSASGGLLGFAGQPNEEDLRFAASMPILDAADGRYAPYMNFRGGMR